MFTKYSTINQLCAYFLAITFSVFFKTQAANYAVILGGGCYHPMHGDVEKQIFNVDVKNLAQRLYQENWNIEIAFGDSGSEMATWRFTKNQNTSAQLNINGVASRAAYIQALDNVIAKLAYDKNDPQVLFTFHGHQEAVNNNPSYCGSQREMINFNDQEIKSRIERIAQHAKLAMVDSGCFGGSFGEYFSALGACALANQSKICPSPYSPEPYTPFKNDNSIYMGATSFLSHLLWVARSDDYNAKRFDLGNDEALSMAEVGFYTLLGSNAPVIKAPNTVAVQPYYNEENEIFQDVSHSIMILSAASDQFIVEHIEDPEFKNIVQQAKSDSTWEGSGQYVRNEDVVSDYPPMQDYLNEHVQVLRVFLQQINISDLEQHSKINAYLNLIDQGFVPLDYLKDYVSYLEELDEIEQEMIVLKEQQRSYYSALRDSEKILKSYEDSFDQSLDTYAINIEKVFFDSARELYFKDRDEMNTLYADEKEFIQALKSLGFEHLSSMGELKQKEKGGNYYFFPNFFNFMSSNNETGRRLAYRDIGRSICRSKNINWSHGIGEVIEKTLIKHFATAFDILMSEVVAGTYPEPNLLTIGEHSFIGALKECFRCSIANNEIHKKYVYARHRSSTLPGLASHALNLIRANALYQHSNRASQCKAFTFFNFN